MNYWGIRALCLTVAVISSLNASVTTHFDQIKSSPTALYAFLKNMPKGGELHYHLAGSAYPETMLTLAKDNHFCINTSSNTALPFSEHCEGFNAGDLDLRPDIYNKMLHAWSLKDFHPIKESGHDHFFNSFPKFMSIVQQYTPTLLAEVIKRAASQNEVYLEVMILPDNANSLQFGQPLTAPLNNEKTLKKLLTNTAFKNNITQAKLTASQLLPQTRQIMGCDKTPQQSNCQLTIKFQYYLLREQPLNTFFAEALTAFEVANGSSDIVGINLVQAEDGLLSLRYYKQQMAILAFLHQHYPHVLIALHAGELAPQAVTPEQLRFHIHDAIFTGHAKRIGHGVDIAYETNAINLVNYMALHHIPVEINLTSNHKILNVKGKEHPLNFYLSHNVPVVLSTDDEGVLRTDLTHEYVKAVIEHHIDYPTLKHINRNAITYSFLPGTSLWVDEMLAKPIAACTDLDSPSCLNFQKDNPKGQLQILLEKQLTAFEKAYHTL